MSKKSNWPKMFAIAAAVAGVGAMAVYVVKLLREKGDTVEEAIDELLEFYAGKAAELDKLVTETELRVANS